MAVNIERREVIFNRIEGIKNMYTDTGMVAPMTTTGTQTIIPVYGSSSSATTHPHMSNVSRKRPHEEENYLNFINHSLPHAAVPNPINFNNNRCSAASHSFLGQDVSPHLQMEKLEVDRFITPHMEKVRLELENDRKRDFRRVMAVVGKSIMRRLEAKDEEIQKISKLNRELEERVKALSFDNQIWRDLAQANEATAISLRSNLEQVLSIVHDDHEHRLQGDDQSCCGSNYDEDNGKIDGSSDHNGRENRKICRSCGKEEACVLLLPCRHLCLCAICGSIVHICPICTSTKSFSLHVNMSY